MVAEEYILNSIAKPRFGLFVIGRIKPPTTSQIPGRCKAFMQAAFAVRLPASVFIQDYPLGLPRFSR